MFKLLILLSILVPVAVRAQTAPTDMSAVEKFISDLEKLDPKVREEIFRNAQRDRAGTDKKTYHNISVSSQYASPKGTITLEGTGVIVTNLGLTAYNKAVYQSLLRRQAKVDIYARMGPEEKLYQTWCDNCRFFVITASHVSQGANARVVVNGKEQQIIGRYADLIRDVEVLELRNNLYLRPQSFFTDKANGFGSTFNFIDGLYYDWRDESVYSTVTVSSNDYRHNPEAFVIIPNIKINGQPKPFKRPVGGVVGRSIMRNGYGELMVNAWLPPGFSGAPMFTSIEFGQIMTGVVTQYDRVLQYSYLPWDKTLVDTFRAFLNKSRGVKTESGLSFKWLHNGLTTYRVAVDKSGNERIKETEILKGNAGNGTGGDGGNGTGGDGGNGTGGDGGNGTGGDGGNGTGGDGGNGTGGDGGNGTGGDGGNGTGGDGGNGTGGDGGRGSTREFINTLTDGLWIDHSHVMGFTLKDGSSIVADIQSYALYRDKVKSLIQWRADLLPYFIKKQEKKFTYQDIHKYPEYRVVSSRRTPMVKSVLRGGEIDLIITDEFHRDSLNVTVDRFGGVNGMPYKRLARVRSKNGVVYTIDVTGLFLNDYKNVDPTSELIKRNAPYIFLERTGETVRYITAVL